MELETLGQVHALWITGTSQNGTAKRVGIERGEICKARREIREILNGGGTRRVALFGATSGALYGTAEDCGVTAQDLLEWKP